MRTEIVIVMTSDEAERRLPYKCLCELWSHFKTGRGQRVLAELGLTMEEMRPYHKKAYDWYLYRGLPQEIQMSPEELETWDRITRAIEVL